MPLEATVTTIADLVATDPLDTDVAQQGAGHIRNIKTALKGTFPNVKGAVNASDAELNNITNSLSSDGETITIPTLSVTKSASVPALTDWSGYAAVGAKDADARYARLASANTFTGNSTFSGAVNVTGTFTYNGVGVATTDDVSKATTAVETWGTGSFVGKAAGDQDYTPLQAGVNKTSGEIWLSYTNSSGTVEYAFAQVAGDYQAAGDYVKSSGDIMTGGLTLSAENTVSGLYWGAQLYSIIKNQSGGSSTGDYSFGLWAQQLPGTYTAGILSLNGYQGRKDFRFNEDGNIFTPLGTVALASELPTSGIIAANGNYGACYWTQIGDVLTQTFKYTMDGGGDQITWPRAFSSNDVVPVCKGFASGGYQEGGFEPATVNSTGGKLDRFNYDQGDSVVYITVTGPA